ncbi:hypothetical protein LEP1GSC151_4485 [Leptospira interrogans serovar Grippotyphosa str. LT2186]|uniref:Uncharacterized protein n=1 Tax=Leptospira interrogans serovar Grippotyphosa str. LT2186 TaxID=1001599 RepID=M3FPQ9_LEPIR|nr:hypothetical protein LEP1GSC009_2998 [Leptospira interrogans serovar Grippotyphosa str. Andaman]EKP87167.1 hypothetical protein LEP1GSC020_2528 [Leptospira interrogans serovar Grippotyphosa str. 2006006986]EMG09444.1 hypothetical protein LEP1GSC151_4485 [Leptospira interrogans serovar Grippotyphosa str. LT2186]EMN73439.1 hypothetical protein LEP1GSC100_2206 [Leptospira interrogans serovar Bataviae str. UI 08561]
MLKNSAIELFLVLKRPSLILTERNTMNFNTNFSLEQNSKYSDLIPLKAMNIFRSFQ